MQDSFLNINKQVLKKDHFSASETSKYQLTQSENAFLRIVLSPVNNTNSCHLFPAFADQVELQLRDKKDKVKEDVKLQVADQH